MDIKKIDVDGGMITSVVCGNDCVGGYFGKCQLAGGVLIFGGAEGSNRYVVKSSAAAGVEGHNYVGGLAGFLDTNGKEVRFDSKVEIAVNVSGEESVGGAVGYALGLNGFNPYMLNFSSSSMRVTSSGKNAGE